MDLEGVRHVMRRVAEAIPAWLNWRQDTLLAQSRFAGESQTEAAARRMTDIWQRNLADVTVGEAEAVLDLLNVGRLTAPPYGELPVWLRREAVARRTPADEQRLVLNYASDRTYRCLHCRDTGAAHVLDPDFVSRFRTKFLAMQPEDFESTAEGSWWRRAKDSYRREHQTGKIEYAVACDCEAGRDRQDRQRRLDSARMPVLHGILWVDDVLRKWYETHEPSDVTFWIVPEADEVQFAP